MDDGNDKNKAPSYDFSTFPDAAELAGEDKMDYLSRLVGEQRSHEIDEELLREQLADVKAKITFLRDKAVPKAARNANLPKGTVTVKAKRKDAEGNDVEELVDVAFVLKPDIYGTIPDQEKDPVGHEAAIAWYVDNGEGDAVKRLLIISIDTTPDPDCATCKGQGFTTSGEGKQKTKDKCECVLRAKAVETRIMEGVRRVAPRATISAKTSIHPSTALARVRPRLEKGKLATDTEDAEQVLKKLGLIQITRAKLSYD